MFVKHAEPFGGLAFCVMEVADAVFAHQPCRLLGDAKPIALHTVMRMDAVVLASRHAPASSSVTAASSWPEALPKVKISQKCR